MTEKHGFLIFGVGLAIALLLALNHKPEQGDVSDLFDAPAQYKPSEMRYMAMQASLAPKGCHCVAAR